MSYVQMPQQKSSIIATAIFIGVTLFILCIALAFICTSCTSLPQFFQASENVLDDTAIKIEVSKEAINQGTNVYANVNVMNKEISK